MAQHGLSLLRWAKSRRTSLGAEASGLIPGVKPGFDPPEWFARVANELGTLVDPIGFDQWSFTPTRAFVAGYEAALRDVWAALEQVPTAPADGADDSSPVSQEQQSEPRPGEREAIATGGACCVKAHGSRDIAARLRLPLACDVGHWIMLE